MESTVPEVRAAESDWDGEPAADPIIMMIDDEPLNLEVLQTFLEEAGYREFLPVTAPLEALGIIADRRPDVVLLDLVMPEMSGFEILSAARGRHAAPYAGDRPLGHRRRTKAQGARAGRPTSWRSRSIRASSRCGCGTRSRRRPTAIASRTTMR
jgi:hypothetical protein